MARVTQKRKPEAAAATPLAAAHAKSISTRCACENYSAYTVRNRRVHIGFFLDWCQRTRHRQTQWKSHARCWNAISGHLFHYRKKNGEPLTFRTQHARLVPMRVWFRWLTRQNHILHNPASESGLPRSDTRLPKHVLNASEVEQVMLQPNFADPLGLRDRAILETLYSTGMRPHGTRQPETVRSGHRARHGDRSARARARKTA